MERLKQTIWLVVKILLIILILISAILVYSFFNTDYYQKTAAVNEAAERICVSLVDQADFSNGYVEGGVYGKCLHDNGYICDYGYSEKYTGCCDEGDYSCEACQENLYDCKDFSSQTRAQNIYNECWNFSDQDIHDLDADGNGIACESLPN